MKEDANSVSEGSVFKETNTSDESLVDQDTESYNTDQEDLVESDGSQRTEIDATNCTSSDTEIEEPEQCQPEVASFVDVDTAALMSDEGSSHSDMLHENLQPIIQRQIYHGQPALRQGSDSKVSTLLKELKQIASGSPSSSSTSSDAREKVVTLDAKQAQPSRQATVESTSVAASPLLSVTSASLSRQISVLPVATAGCSSKVTVLPVNVTVLPATSAATSSTITTNTTDASVAGGAKALPQASSSRASPHSILQKLQRNLGLTVRPVQQKEKLAKDSTATDGSPLQKNVPADVTTSSSETASVSRNNVIAIPSGLSITSAPARVSSADKAATKTAEQVAVIQLGKGNQRQLPLPTAKPTTAPTASTAPGMRVNMAALQQSTSAAAAQAALQRTVNASGSASRTVPPQQQRPVVYSRHVVDARPTQTSSAHPSPIVSRPVTIVASSGTAAPPASKTSTVTTTSQRLLLPRLPAGVVQPASTVPRQTVPKQPPVQAATSVAPVLVQATTLQDVRWSQHQQNQQLCLTVPGFRVVQSPSFQSRAVVVPPPPPLQWCGPTVAVGRPVSTNFHSHGEALRHKTLALWLGHTQVDSECFLGKPCQHSSQYCRSLHHTTDNPKFTLGPSSSAF
ncbi:hypothetical protein HPB52_000886 [Rhipicephalus sanguineus]|uniref:Uncharacterized protein n=1 Tax=Rhipicephalus sanguineus TaxID=34632 RepID=A0A9D4PUQ7_RHISA|nr:hypothetical protein HPB52_000886 [Rhipicephalus sanguineus]